MYYSLDSGDATYGVMIDGVMLNLPYKAFAGFVVSHPDNEAGMQEFQASATLSQSMKNLPTG